MRNDGDTVYVSVIDENGNALVHLWGIDPVHIDPPKYDPAILDDNKDWEKTLEEKETEEIEQQDLKDIMRYAAYFIVAIIILIIFF